MPVEIRELVIRAVVAEKELAASAQSQASAEPSVTDTEAIVQECVRQVLRILKQKEDR